jgi:nucleotide-binding universal stress UspA family protein
VRILVAIDGSPCSEAVVHSVSARPWPPDSEIRILTVVSSRLPLIPEPTLTLAAAYETVLAESRSRAPATVNSAASEIRAAQPQLHVMTSILEGSPKRVIVEEAQEWPADLIVLGSHGFGVASRFLLGSVSQAVALHAPCSVEIVRGAPCSDAGS